VLRDPSLAPSSRSDALLAALVGALAARPDGIGSEDLIAQFESQIGPSEAEKLVFRQLLRQIANLVGPTKAKRRWVLKEEFR